MNSEDVDAEELFQRIQRNLLQVEEEDEVEAGTESIDPSEMLKSILERRDQEGDEQIDEGEDSQTTASKPESEQVEKKEAQSEAGNADTQKKKVYQFTEVSGGAKKDIRRFSQSKQFTGLQSVPTHGPLLRSQDISMYKPSTDKLEELLKRIQKHNQQKLEVLSTNQVAITKRRRTSSNGS
jgi:hypothetical protein